MSNIEHMTAALKFMHPNLGVAGCGVTELCVMGCNGSNAKLWEGFCGGKGGTVAGWFDNINTVAQLAADIDAGWNFKGTPQHPSAIYITVNPVHDSLMGRSNKKLKAGVGRTTDKDILYYDNIFIDIDAKIATGVSADEAEHSHALELAQVVREWIRDTFFWADPLYANSGNGAHLVYKAHFNSTPENAKTLSTFINLLDKKFGYMLDGRTPIKVDSTSFNPSRLIKLYGTMARKGDPTDTRPHRRSHIIDNIISIPDNLLNGSLVTLPLLESAIQHLQRDLDTDTASGKIQDTRNTTTVPNNTAYVNSNQRPDTTNMFQSIAGVQPLRKGGTLKLDEYLRHYDIEVKVIKAGPGDSRLFILEKCLFDDSHEGGEAAIGQSADGKLWYQCFHDTCKSDVERKWPQARIIISGKDKLGEWMEGGSFGIDFPYLSAKKLPYARVENFKVIVDAYNVALRHNTMTRRTEYKLPADLWGTSDRLNNLAHDFLEEVCTRHGMATGRLDTLIRLVSEENAYHPAKAWIDSKPWDSLSRLEALACTVTVPLSQRDQWRVYIKRWLIQAVAALYCDTFSGRGVLTFTGLQLAGKTSWFRKLVPASLGAFGEGLHIDPADKDSKLEVLSRWIVELGEIDATFKKADISRLKAFITKKEDELRPPYGHCVEIWRRQTVFGGTVDSQEFLVDPAGNTRFWVIETLGINFKHDIDMQQVWAEAKVLYESGVSWFLNDAETIELNRMNKDYEIPDVIEENILKFFCFDTLTKGEVNYMTTTEVLEYVGTRNINRGHTTKAGSILKRLVGNAQQRRVNGVQGRYYALPAKRDMFENVGSNNISSNVPGNVSGDVLPFNKS